MPSPHAIAVWNTAFLGDAVLTLPLVRTLKTAFPEADIDFYVRAGLGTLFAAQPELRRVFEIQKGRQGIGALRAQCQDIAARRYDVWVDAHPSPRSALIARFSGAPLRVGYSGLPRSLAFTHAVPRRFDELDETERLLQLTTPVFRHFNIQLPGFSPDIPDDDLHWPCLALAEEACGHAEAFFSSLPAGPCLGLHPGSRWATKRWTPEGFAGIARKAAGIGANVLVFSGSQEETRIAREVIRLAGLEGSPRLFDLSGSLPLPHLAAFLRRLSVYVSNDSGPLHLAWCQRVPTAAIFGPTVRRLGFFPRGKSSTVLEVPESELACRPCSLHGPNACPQRHHRCMKDILPEEVWQHVLPYLNQAGTSPE